METGEAADRHEPTYESQDGQETQWNPNSATTLSSGTLVCGYCGEELTLARSDGKYKLMGCKNRTGRRCGSELTTSKSTRIIEAALLGYIVDQILGDANLADFVGKANSMLEVEARRPTRDVRPLDAKVAKLPKRTRNLLATIADEDDAEVRRAYHQEVEKHRTTITELSKEIEKAGSGLAEPTEATHVDRSPGIAFRNARASTTRKSRPPQKRWGTYGANLHPGGKAAGAPTGRPLDRDVAPDLVAFLARRARRREFQIRLLWTT